MEIKGTFQKVDETQGLAFGWAMLSIKKDGDQLVDLQGDLIDPEELERAAYDFVLTFANEAVGEMHKGEALGRIVESVVFTDQKLEAMGIAKADVPRGWWIGVKIDDQTVFNKIKTGEYKGFSVQGSAVREEVK